jgi:hypothetical protein
VHNICCEAVFGVVWNHFHAQSVCFTVDDFKAGVIAAFKNSKLKVTFHDLVFQVPDYETMIAKFWIHILELVLKLRRRCINVIIIFNY